MTSPLARVAQMTEESDVSRPIEKDDPADSSSSETSQRTAGSSTDSAIQDIVIPQHLLSSVIAGLSSAGIGPTERKLSRAPRRDSDNDFDVQQMAVAQARGALEEIATQGETSRDGVLGRRGTVTWDAQMPTGDDLRRDTRGSSAKEMRGSTASREPDLESGRPFWKPSTGSPFASPVKTKTVRLPPAAESTGPPKRTTLWSTIDPFDSYRSGLTVGDDDDPKWDDFGVDGKRRGTNSIDPTVPSLGWADGARPSILRPRFDSARSSNGHAPRAAGSIAIVDRRGSSVVIRPRGSSAAKSRPSNARKLSRRGSLWDVYERAKVRGVELQRQRWVQLVFEYTFYVIILAFVYLVLVGMPLWKGAVYWLYWVVKNKFVVTGTWSVTLGVATIYAFAPLLVQFEKYPAMPEGYPDNIDPNKTPGVLDTALLIPCYKSENIIGPTLVAALKVFPASHIYVLANGNSPTPLDNTEAVCDKYGVNHVWSPVGSKIIAQFVGCYAARRFKNVLLIDDDCALPPNFPIVSDRMKGKIQCIGYTIKSVGPESSKGTYCQQAQDLEYKLSGIQRDFAGKIGSATFPHGAISIWNTEFLISTFHQHPGYTVSEDWFFGHAARQLGCRITMCTSVFIETETPNALFFSSGGARGGFGEMTVFKQRFMRWNFFFVNGLWYNMDYIIRAWKLGWWEFGAKLFVFQEVYETLLYLFAPLYLPISFAVNAKFTAYLTVGVLGMYFLNAAIFNEVHLRRKGERIEWKAIYLYYMGYKCVLTFVNIASCYWSIYKYAQYFSQRHPKIVEDEKAIDVVLRLEDPAASRTDGARRMTVTAIGSKVRASLVERDGESLSEKRVTVMTIGPNIQSGGKLGERRMTVKLERDAHQ